MKLEKIINEIEKIFPLKTAEEFDNVGLLLGKNYSITAFCSILLCYLHFYTSLHTL